MVLAWTLPLTSIPPLTDNPDNMPTLVMLGCAAVVSVPVTVVNTPPVAPILPTLLLPLTLKLVNVPVLVMFGWAPVVSVPVNKLPETFPVTVTLLLAIKLPWIVTFPTLLPTITLATNPKLISTMPELKIPAAFPITAIAPVAISTHPLFDTR